MASISKDASGNRTIQFVAADGKRRSIRLGKVNAKLAESFKLKVETLAASVATKMPLDSESSAWLGNIGDDLAAKLAAVGLIPERQSRKLGEFLEAYLSQRRGDSKPSTIANIYRVMFDLKAFFGAETPLRNIDVEKAELLKTDYQTRVKKLAGATIYRRLKMARMLFGYAVKLKLISSNPFAEVKAKNANPPERLHFVTPEDTDKLIGASNLGLSGWRSRRKLL